MSAKNSNVVRKTTGENAPKKTSHHRYELPDLPYPYEGLEPSIDAATMKFHHDKHHATYVAGINGALERPTTVSIENSVGA